MAKPRMQPPNLWPGSTDLLRRFSGSAGVVGVTASSSETFYIDLEDDSGVLLTEDGDKLEQEEAP